jgi:hypothetical protein
VSILNEDIKTTRELVLKRCQDQIMWYEKTKRQTRNLHQSLKISTIVLGGLTPLLILWSDLPKPIQALPSALAAMTAALNGAFRPRDNYIRFAYVAETLKSEKFKFETRTTKDYSRTVDEYQALENFVTRIESLMASEVSDWRTLAEKEKAEATESK